MGRHQLFVIAKVADRYRCLAGVHHPELYGAGALRTCLRLINIFQCNQNRRGLQHELQYAAKQRWTAEDQVIGGSSADSKILADTSEDVPFPLIMTCLVVGASINARDAKFSDVLTLPFNTPFNASRNDEGVTIIDISNLANIRYCFVSYCGLQGPYDESIPNMTPLSGATYLSAYQRKPNTDQPFSRWTIALDQLLEDFKTMPLVDSRTLKETWPRHRWSSDEFEDDPEDADDTSFPERNIGSETRDTPGAARGPAASDGDMAIRTTCASLRDMAMEKLLIELVKLPEEELEPVVVEAENLSDFKRVSLRWLERDPNVLKDSPAGIVLLARILVGEKLVDLSKFPAMTNEEIAVLFEKASLSDTIEILDLSGNHSFTDVILESISRSKSLKSLYTLDTPGLTLSKTCETIYPLSIREFYHTDFFRRTFVTDPRNQLDLQNLSDPARPVQLLFGIKHDFGTAHSEELLIDYENDAEERTIEYLRNGELLWQSAALDIRDALLRPETIVFSLSRLILHCCKSGVLQTSRRSLLTNFAVRYASDNHIGTIPGFSHIPEQFGTIGEARDIRPGEWTIVLIKEWSDDKCVKYAMVTVDQRRSLRVVDFPTFMRLIAEEQSSHSYNFEMIVDQWEKQMEKNAAAISSSGWTIQLCTADEVQEFVILIARCNAHMDDSPSETVRLN